MSEKRLAVVTGGARGIGRTIVFELLKQGRIVAVIDLNSEQLAECEKAAKDAGFEDIVTRCLDITQTAKLIETIEALANEYSGIGILVNNAGIMIVGDVASVEADKWAYGIAVSLTGAFLCSKAVLKYMISRGSGKIINIASRAGKIPSPYISSYSAAKLGLIGLTKSLSDEVKKLGINVNAICPGFVDTRMVRDVGLDKIVKDIMHPQEIADVALFLASEESTSVMGADIEVYGKTERPSAAR